jgi:hypothetical protein
MPKTLNLEVRCECGTTHNPTQSNYIYITPKSNYYHYLVEWNCRECGDRNWDEGDYLYEWLDD